MQTAPVACRHPARTRHQGLIYIWRLCSCDRQALNRKHKSSNSRLYNYFTQRVLVSRAGPPESTVMADVV